MEKMDILKFLIKSRGSVVFSYDNSRDLITYVVYYEKNELKEIKNELSLNEFSSFIMDFFDVKINLKYVKEEVLKNITKDHTFNLQFVFKNSKDKPVKFCFKGGRYDDNRVVASFYLEKDNRNDQIDELTKTISPLDIKQQIEDLLAKKEDFMLGIIDIDNFEDFNKKYGNILGDIILIEVVSITKDILANNGVISRIGGDSFLFYYKIASDYEKTRNFVLEIRNTMKEMVNKALNVDANITVTLGISRSNVDGTDFNILYNKALSALKRGKKKSRDCFIIYFEDKCGPVDSLDHFKSNAFEISKTANYSAISAVVEVLNSNLSFRRRIEEALNLIGKFFMLDRITLIEIDTQSEKIKNVLAWYNPVSEKLGYNFADENQDAWRAALGKANLLVIDDTYHFENEKIQKTLFNSNIYAVVASELRMSGKCFGLIQFEMTSHYRYWLQDDVKALSLLAKIITVRYNKEYETYIHFKQMYFDEETELYNFHKWYIDVDEILKENKLEQKIEKYTILDIGITKYTALVNIAGIKFVRTVLKTIADSIRGLETMGIRYCRSYENRFTLFFPSDDTFLVKNVFKKVINAVNEIEALDGEKINIQGGFNVVSVLDEQDLDEEVNRAIMARKNVTEANKCLQFTQEMLEIDRVKTLLTSHIENALDNNEFILYLQPKISTVTGKLAGAEALTRWNYNFEKLIFPNDFIPLLEETGYIARLDFSVFENVCIFIKNLEKEGKLIVPISVNVSRAINNFDYYFTKIEKIRKKYNVDSKYIEIEITEGMYSNNNEAIKSFIEKLHSVGYGVSMDDFGSGNSNISTLSQLKFDIIKFDRGFFQDINNEKEKLIIDSMTKLVKNMNMKVVCEGIETKDYVDYLTKIGCDYIQGYYFDKPIKLESFKEKYIN